MKKLFLVVVFSFLAFAMDVNGILAKVPKNSPSYTLDKAIAEKIKTLTFQPPEINVSNIINQYDYYEAFLKLINLEEEYLILPQKMSELQKKLAILNGSSKPTDELQYLYYKKKLSIDEKTFNYLKKNLKKFEKELFRRLQSVFFDLKSVKKDLNYWQTLLLQKQKEYEKLKIDLQKWQLLENEKNIKNIEKYIRINRQKTKTIYRQLFKDWTIIWLKDLKDGNKNVFKDDNFVLLYAKKIDKNFYTAADDVVSDFETYKFGSKVLVYNTKKELDVTWYKIKELFNYPLFKVGQRIITPINFAILVIILIIGWYIGKYYKRFIYKLRRKYRISHSTATLLGNMGYYAILVISFLFALKAVGLDLSSLTIIAGALSVGIGFGLQNIVSNFVSGIILMFENSIKVGDYIQIDENTRGEVIDISMRSTVIRTNDNINLIIPNQSFIQNNVINWTLGDDIVRFRVPFGVEYGSDIDKVEKVILNAVSKSNLPFVRKHSKYDVRPKVIFMEMADSSLNFELFVWVKGEDARRPRRTTSKFLKVIYNALNEAGIGIPFPQQDLHIKDSVPFEIKIKKE
jgi:small-conductance mechanosensitive channel